MNYVFIALVAFMLAIVLSPFTIRLSEKLNIFSKPNNRDLKGKPCLGGIAIYIAFIVSFISACFLYPIYSQQLIGLIVSSALIVFLGLVDDAKDLKPFVKIIVELIAIAILILFGIVIEISFLPIWINILITFIWVLFITNAFNLLDIVDGLTSGLVVIISLTLLIISLINNDLFSSIVLLSLIGAHFGFLRYNYPPARLYMGDTGSLFSGFLLASIAINISYASLEKPIALITPILAMSLPIYDTLFLIIMRAGKQKPIFRKTDDHFTLRLMTMGNSVRKSIGIMYLFSIFLAISSVIVVFSNNLVGSIVVVMILMIFIFMGKKVAMVKIEDK